MNDSKFRVTSVFVALFAFGVLVQACGATGATQQRPTSSAVVSTSPAQR